MGWKWFGDLDEDEKTKAREALAKHPELRGQKLAWDGTHLLRYMRPPTQAYNFQDDTGKWLPEVQAMMDSGDMFDTLDGGVLILVPVLEKVKTCHKT